MEKKLKATEVISIENERFEVFYFSFIHVLTIKDGLRFLCLCFFMPFFLCTFSLWWCLRSITLLISHFFRSRVCKCRKIRRTKKMKKKIKQNISRRTDANCDSIFNWWCGWWIYIGTTIYALNRERSQFWMLKMRKNKKV